MPLMKMGSAWSERRSLPFPAKMAKRRWPRRWPCVTCLGPEAEQRGKFSALHPTGNRPQSSIGKWKQSFLVGARNLHAGAISRSFHKTITDTMTGSVYKAMTADARKAHGLSPSFMVYDELAQSQ